MFGVRWFWAILFLYGDICIMDCLLVGILITHVKDTWWCDEVLGLIRGVSLVHTLLDTSLLTIYLWTTMWVMRCSSEGYSLFHLFLPPRALYIGDCTFICSLVSTLVRGGLLPSLLYSSSCSMSYRVEYSPFAHIPRWLVFHRLHWCTFHDICCFDLGVP